MHRDWRRQNTVTEPQTSNAGRSGRKVVLENLFRLPQRQSQHWESSPIGGSANTRLMISVLTISSKTSLLCVFICLSFKALFFVLFWFFLFLPKRKKNDFYFWCSPNETFSPFPWRQSQNCQVPSLSKQKKKKKVLSGEGWWWGLGLFFNCQKQVFKERVIPLGRWNFHCIFFFVNSAGLQALGFFFSFSFITTPTLAASKNASLTITE